MSLSPPSFPQLTKATPGVDVINLFYQSTIAMPRLNKAILLGHVTSFNQLGRFILA